MHVSSYLQAVRKTHQEPLWANAINQQQRGPTLWPNRGPFNASSEGPTRAITQFLHPIETKIYVEDPRW